MSKHPKPQIVSETSEPVARGISAVGHSRQDLVDHPESQREARQPDQFRSIVRRAPGLRFAYAMDINQPVWQLIRETKVTSPTAIPLAP